MMKMSFSTASIFVAPPVRVPPGWLHPVLSLPGPARDVAVTTSGSAVEVCSGSFSEIVGSRRIDSAIQPTAEPKRAPISELRWAANGQLRPLVLIQIVMNTRLSSSKSPTSETQVYELPIPTDFWQYSFNAAYTPLKGKPLDHNMASQ